MALTKTMEETSERPASGPAVDSRPPAPQRPIGPWPKPAVRAIAPGFGAASRVETGLMLQRSVGNTRVGQLAAGAPLADRIRSAREAGGDPLTVGQRGRLETGLGADLGGVRLHTGPEADRLAWEVNATAFTTGQDIFFRDGAYDPSSAAGLQRLAHEVAHTVQQARGPVAGTAQAGGIAISDPSDPLELAADQAVAHLINPSNQVSPAAAMPDQATLDPTSSVQPTIQRQRSSALTIQWQPQESPPVDDRDRVEHLIPGQYHVVIVGSPGQAEVSAKHPYQFADAAAQRGTGPNTVWLVEETGYSLGEVPLSGVRSRAGASRIFWITPSTPLASLLRQFPAGSIASLEAFSHGLPGLLALRHGWPGQADYGLTTDEARGLSPDSFAPDAKLSFDSCNSATEGDGESLAQAVATSTQHSVRGWVGRTSYREVNRGTGGVVASQIWPSGGSFDWKELGSQLRGRHPQQGTVAPERSPGDFSGGYEITARLPRTRRFPVGSNQRVLLTISAFSEYPTMQGLGIFVLLHREDGEDVGSPRRFAIGTTATFEWWGLKAGAYYFEIYHLHGPLVTGDISVKMAN